MFWKTGTYNKHLSCKEKKEDFESFFNEIKILCLMNYNAILVLKQSQSTDDNFM